MKDFILEEIFLDADGVICDFDKAYLELTGKNIKGEINTKKRNKEENAAFWAPIEAAGIPFWFNLEFSDDGRALWRYVKKYDPVILSSPSKRKESEIGKKLWVKKHLLGTELILCPAEEKCKYAHPNAILIDDRVSNIDDWIKAKGIGILFKSAHQSIKELKKLGL